MSFFALAAGAARPVFQGLGEPAEYRPLAGGAIAGIHAIIELPGEAVRVGGMGAVLEQPRVQVLVEDVPEAVRGDAVHALGRRWKLIEAPQKTEDGVAWVSAAVDDGPAP